MSRISRGAAAAFLSLLLAFCAASLGAQPLPIAKPEHVGMSSQKLAKIGEVFRKEVADGSFRGAGAETFVPGR